MNFDHAHPTSAKARLIDKDGTILDVKSMGFTQRERMALLRLMNTPEEKLDDMTIEEWFADIPTFLPPISGICGRLLLHFRNGAACLSSAVYMRRMILEFSRIEYIGRSDKNSS